MVKIESRIWEIKEALGDSLVILGHHYQRDDVIQFADFRGDSLKLARDAANCRDAKYIVFCGVHFMAETADILSQPEQIVLLPDLEAGCPLAEMASRPDVEEAWAQLGGLMDVEKEMMPITYVNSAAALKAFCGQHGGSACTSSNATGVLRWAFAQRPRVLFFPDQHLGRNTAKKMGIPLEEMMLWNPSLPLGGNDVETLEREVVAILEFGEAEPWVHASATPDFYGNLYFAEAGGSPTGMTIYRPDWVDYDKQVFSWKDIKQWG